MEVRRSGTATPSSRSVTLNVRGLTYPLLTLLGECSDDDWLEVARPNILDRMYAYAEENIEFSILGLVRDPLPDLIQQLAVNVRSLEILNERLMSQEGGAPETEATLLALKETVLGPDSSLALTRADIDAAVVPDAIQAGSQNSLSEQLRQHQQGLSTAQRELRGRIREQQQTQRADEDHATGRRHDYGPAIRTWLRCLARKQLLAELLQ